MARAEAEGAEGGGEGEADCCTCLLLVPLIRIFLCGDQSLPLDLNETGILPGPEKSGEAPTKIFDRMMMRVIRTNDSFLHLNEERHG